MKIKKCCKEISEYVVSASRDQVKTYFSFFDDNVKVGTTLFTSPGMRTEPVPIKYCPFCGKKIKVKKVLDLDKNLKKKKGGN